MSEEGEKGTGHFQAWARSGISPPVLKNLTPQQAKKIIADGKKLENPVQNARLKELTDLIEKERDHDKFTELIAELNALLDEQKKASQQIANRIDLAQTTFAGCAASRPV